MIYLSQINPKWKNIKLGTCVDTLGMSGCKLMSACMLAYRDPVEVNAEFIKNNMEGYDVKHGGFISIQPEDLVVYDNPAWYKRNDKSIFNFSFDCKNIKASENNLKAFLLEHFQKAIRN